MALQPKIFVINLDSSPDRLTTCTQRLNEQGLTFDRISGVYGKDLRPEEIAQNYSEQKNAKHFYRALSKGEIGCYYSHRKAWQKIVDEQLEYAIILEDDFKLKGDLSRVFSVLSSLTIEWDLIKLAAYQNRTRPVAYEHEIEDNFSLVVHKKAMTGCCAQAISLNGAKKLLKATEKFGRPVDTDIQHVWETDVPVYSLMPYFIEQDMAFDSDIAQVSSEDKIKKQFWKRKLQQIIEKKNNKKHTKQIISNLQLKLR